MLILLFALVALLQAALVYYQHFSPFERESNLRAVLCGAKPGPRYWAVLVLDICTGLLIFCLVLGLLPRAQNDVPVERLVRTLPAWVAVSLLAALLHGYINATIIRFPDYRLIARRGGLAFVFCTGLVAATLFAVALAIMPDLSTATTAWVLTLPGIFLPAFFLAIGIYIIRALAFLLRVLPLVGSFSHTAVSTGAFIFLLYTYGQWMMRVPSPYAGLAGLEYVAITLATVAIIALVTAWVLPGVVKHADALVPPPLVVEKPREVATWSDIGYKSAVIATSQVRVEVTRVPFGIRIENARGELLWELAENGLTRDLLLYKILAIPVLYTGNTMKFKWHAWSRPVRHISHMEAKDNTLTVLVDDLTLRLSFHADDILRITAEPVRSRFQFLKNVTSLSFVNFDDAHYLGFGQRFGRIDHRGQDIDFLVEEGGVGYSRFEPLLKYVFGERGSVPNGEQCTGFPIPFGLIAREQCATVGFFWSTYLPSWITIRKSGPVRLTVLDNTLDFYLCVGPTPLDAIQQYTSLTGQPQLPPPWALLPWKTRTGAVLEADVREDIHRFRELDIPLAQVGIEHWQEVRGSYEFSKQWYPNINDLIADARSNGHRVHIWHFPYMNAGAATHRDGVRRGYFLSNRLGLPYQQRIFHGIAAVVDYANPHAAAWHAGIVRQALYARGIHGVMTDYAESIPPDCVSYNGRSGLEMRNAYPVMYEMTMQRAAQDSLGNDYVIYPRAGYAGSQRYVNAQWPGDQDTDWDEGDGLPAAVRAMLNISMGGFPVHGSDIGGWYDWYTPFTTKELYIRWAEVGAYSPLMRAHGGPIGRNREPWKFDEETVEIYRALSAEHVRLFPFLFSLAEQATHTGIPIIRHPALLWPQCAQLYTIEDAWMMGDALYIAPVVRKGVTRRRVVLPPGEWWSLTENRPVQGPATIDVEAPLGQTPRFLRRGFILPRFVKAFDTFDQVTTAQVGHLDDDIEAWLYPHDAVPPFALFDGTTLHNGAECAGNRCVNWKIFGSHA